MKRSLSLIFGFIIVLSLFICGCDSTNSQNDGGTVTISIRCDTAVDNGMNLLDKWKGIIPDDGCILGETNVPINDGDTVFDVLCYVRDKNAIQMEYSGAGANAYIKGIGNLYEFDGGRWSGWVYFVNEKQGEKGCGQYQLSNGDEIKWAYTCDLGTDLDGMDDDAIKEANEWKEQNS